MNIYGGGVMAAAPNATGHPENTCIRRVDECHLDGNVKPLSFGASNRPGKGFSRERGFDDEAAARFDSLGNIADKGAAGRNGSRSRIVGRYLCRDLIGTNVRVPPLTDRSSNKRGLAGPVGTTDDEHLR